MSDLPELMTLADVLKRLRGRVGRTNLIAHLQAFPAYGGGPTHRKNGRKILFTAGDYGRLIESFAATVEPKPRVFHPRPPRRSPQAGKSKKSAYERALELLR